MVSSQGCTWLKVVLGEAVWLLEPQDLEGHTVKRVLIEHVEERIDRHCEMMKSVSGVQRGGSVVKVLADIPEDPIAGNTARYHHT